MSGSTKASPKMALIFIATDTSNAFANFARKLPFDPAVLSHGSSTKFSIKTSWYGAESYDSAGTAKIRWSLKVPATYSSGTISCSANNGGG